MMNKYHEALEFLRSEDVTALGNENFELLYFHLDNIEELVDKATPKKIIRTVNGEPFVPRGYGKCPKCKTVVGCSDKYCRECGQRLE